MGAQAATLKFLEQYQWVLDGATAATVKIKEKTGADIQPIELI